MLETRGRNELNITKPNTNLLKTSAVFDPHQIPTI